jgi:putative ABC transport system permease protein
MTVLVRSSLPLTTLVPSVRRAVSSLDPQQPVAQVRSLDDLLAQSAARPRFYFTLLGAFAVIALTLAGAGMYAVMAFMVRQRTREIGVRMALGADRGAVLRTVLGRGGRLIAAGVLLGLAGSWGTTRLLRGLLSGVSATDPIVLASVTALLAGVALAANYLPAREATRVDPTIALRAE